MGKQTKDLEGTVTDRGSAGGHSAKSSVTMIRRLVLIVCVLAALSQSLALPATGIQAAGTRLLTCDKYGYSITIGSDWGVKDPCTMSTVITSKQGFNLGIVLRKGSTWSLESAKGTMEDLVSGFQGYTRIGNPKFTHVTTGGRSWSLGVIGLKDAEGTIYTLDDLETFDGGIIYDFVADVVRQDNSDADTRRTQMVGDTLSSVKITGAAAPAKPTAAGKPAPKPTAPAPTARPTAAGRPGATSAPAQDAIGTWAATSISMIQYHNVTTGTSGPANGGRIELDITGDGRYTYSGLLQSVSYSCVDALFELETGTATMVKNHLTLVPEKHTLTSKDNCNAKFNYVKQLDLTKKNYLWKVDHFQRGTKLCLLQDDKDKSTSCFWRSGVDPVKATVDPVTGASWASRHSGTDHSLRGVSCRSANACMAVGDSNMVLVTADGGKSWTKASPPDFDEGIKSVACTSGGSCVGVGVSILRSAGGDDTLKPQSNDLGWMNSVSCAGESFCVAVGNSGHVITTTDGGATWTARSSGSDAILNSISCAGASLCVAVGGSWGKHGTVLTSTDGGLTWTRRVNEPKFELDGVTCAGTHLCIAVGVTESEVDGVMLTSVDGGVTWNAHAPGFDNILEGNALNSVSCTSSGNCVAVGERGTILTSTDGGASWRGQVATGSTAYTSLLSVSCARADACVAVGKYGIVLQLKR